MRTLALFLFFCFVAAASAQTFKWTNCSPNTFPIATASMSPDPAIPGQNVVFNATGNQENILTGGSWKTTVYLGPIPVANFSGNNCNDPNVQWVGCAACPCPVDSARVVIFTMQVRSDAPPGATLHGNLTATNGDGSQSFCQTFSFQIAS
jgi:hypothetical protein